MDLSIIIPTHNRADSLRLAMQSVCNLKNEGKFEFIIVDNNSSDHTKSVVADFGDLASYVFEPNTAFSRARRAGGDIAQGEIFAFMDDDLTLEPGALKALLKVFADNPKTGIIAANIEPRFEQNPPEWALELEQSFNGWSLFNPSIYPYLENGRQRVSWSAGPFMPMRRTAYQAAGGFPADTVGVETNKNESSFRKLYIGPGDCGLCERAEEAGFEIWYEPAVRCHHAVPPIRSTVSFWRSRGMGEAHYLAISNRVFSKWGQEKLDLERRNRLNLYAEFRLRIMKRFLTSVRDELPPFSTNEFWALHHKAYLEMDMVMRDHLFLPDFLWAIGRDGVSDNEFESIVARLPKEYLELTSSGVMFSSEPYSTEALISEIFPSIYS